MKLFYLGPESRIQKELKLQPYEQECRELPRVDVIISYRYRHIIPWRILRDYRGRIINVHTSLLPNQRGAHPVFWGFIEGATHGVTIHNIDRGIDTGPIMAQIPVQLNELYCTFRSAWNQMNDIAQDFFLALWPNLLDIEPQSQPLKGGTIHKASDIDRYGKPFNWDANVCDWLDRQGEDEMSNEFWDQYDREIREIKEKHRQ